MKPIAVFYHCLFQLGDEILPQAVDIVHGQMEQLKSSGLLDEASDMVVGCNGGPESKVFCDAILPAKARVTLHGLQCRNECRTLRLLEEWLPGHDDWYVLYFHAKGATHPPGEVIRTPWRECGMRHLVQDWRRCVADLDRGYESAGCHWMQPPLIPDTQFYFAGNFFWARASFLRTLPSLMERARIKDSGIDALESRYEAEVWIGNGPRPPTHMDYHPNWRVSSGAHR